MLELLPFLHVVVITLLCARNPVEVLELNELGALHILHNVLSDLHFNARDRCQLLQFRFVYI